MRTTLLFILIIPTALNAQDVNFAWAKQMGGIGGSGDCKMAADVFGNTYTAGRFVGTMDFDPGPGTFNLIGSSNENIFICKLDAAGNFVWAKQMSGTGSGQANEITLGASGSVYITGSFSGGIIDFDPGAPVFNLSGPPGSSNVFIVKLDAAGNFIWVKAIEGTNSMSFSIATDLAENIYTTGYFSGTNDFDPGTGIFNLSSYAQYADAFVSKLDVAGNFVWAKQMGGPGSASGSSITLDASGNVYTCGYFYGTVDLDPGAGIFNLTGAYQDGYISKLDGAGNFVWTKQIRLLPRSYDDYFPFGSIVTDGPGNVYLAGVFSGSVDVDPGPGEIIFISDSADFFVSELDAAGNFIWAKHIGGVGDVAATSIVLDDSGNIYTTGSFGGTVDFDTGPGIYNLSAIGPANIFVYKLDASGNFAWAKQMGGAGSGQSSSIALDAAKNIFTAGYFGGTVDFDPGPSVFNLNSVGLFSSMFVHKMSPCANSVVVTAQPVNQQACPGTNAVFSITAPGAFTYQWQLSTDGGAVYNNINGATSSSYSLTSVTATQNGYYYRCMVTGECNTTISSSAMLTTITTVISAQPQSVSLCVGRDHTFNVTASGGSAYQWQLSTDGGITFNDITGAIASAYTINSVTYAQNGYNYRCVVTTGCDAIISSIAGLSVIGAVSISSHPAQTEICSGSNASFTVSGSSAQTISYNWQVSIDGGTSYVPVANGGIYSGAGTSMLTITGADASLNNNRYRCELSNSICGVSTISNAAILTVRKLPAIGLAASPLTSLFPWQSTTITATPGSSGGTLSTTWLYNNAIIPNTGNTRPVSFNQLGTYQVRIQERWPSDLVCSNQSDVVIISARAGKELMIYPNPNDGQFKISYYNSDGVSNLKVVTVYDAKGAKVYNARFTITGVYALLDINIIPAAAGFYSVVIADGYGQRLAVGKIIVLY